MVRRRLDGPAQRHPAAEGQARASLRRLRPPLPLPRRGDRPRGAPAAAHGRSRQGLGHVGSRRVPAVLRGLARQQPPGRGARPPTADRPLDARQLRRRAGHLERRLGRRAARREGSPSRRRRELVVLRRPAEPRLRPARQGARPAPRRRPRPELGRAAARRALRPRVLDRVLRRVRPRHRVLRQLRGPRPGMGRAADVPPRKAAASRLPLLDGRRHRRLGRDRREGLPLRRERARAVHRSLASGRSAREARPSTTALAARVVGAAAVDRSRRQGRLVGDARRRRRHGLHRDERRRRRRRRSPHGRTRWKLALPGPTWGSPVVVDGVLVEGDCRGNLRAFDVTGRRPRALWSIRLGGCIESTPAVWRGRIYVGTRGGALYALAARP